MENRDLTALDQLLFNLKAFRRFNIFQINTAKGVGNIGHRVDKLFGGAVFYFDIYRVEPGEAFE